MVVRYLGDNPNGSFRDIAGVCNAAGNVVGLMPHPELQSTRFTGSGVDGLPFFTGVRRSPRPRRRRAEPVAR